MTRTRLGERPSWTLGRGMLVSGRRAPGTSMPYAECDAGPACDPGGGDCDGNGGD
jgi:hypothetical protein